MGKGAEFHSREVFSTGANRPSLIEELSERMSGRGGITQFSAEHPNCAGGLNSDFHGLATNVDHTYHNVIANLYHF